VKEISAGGILVRGGVSSASESSVFIDCLSAPRKSIFPDINRITITIGIINRRRKRRKVEDGKKIKSGLGNREWHDNRN
jgi:hypothetical protein